MPDRPDEVRQAQERARRFVLEEAGFAQVTTLDRHGFPVARTMTAFLRDGWVVDLVQRRSHARLQQLRREPRTLVTWVGLPQPGSTNERPHVFDLGLLPPRAVMIRGSAAFQDEQWTVRTYLEQLELQRAAGQTRAPVRTPEQAAEELVGVRIAPYRVRLEGFGAGAQSFDVVVGPPQHEETQ